MKTLVLNSSQPKYPLGSDPWVKATLHAVDEAAALGHTIVASVGLACWELALWRSAQRNARIHVILPLLGKQQPNTAAEAWSRSFGLPYDRTTFTWIPTNNPKAWWPLRDRIAIRRSDNIVPICLRPSGRLAKELQEAQAEVSPHHAIPWSPKTPTTGWQNRFPLLIQELWPYGALVHLTRACSGPWPGESHESYYHDVVASTQTYARSGLATLIRIIREGRIRGSLFRARANRARVCFSACTTREALGLVRFRSRFARYAFEPYAIVLLAGAIQRLKAHPVRYDANESTDLFGQHPGIHGVWSAEKEWRVLGDVDLRSLDPGDVRVVTATDKEAESLRPWCPWEVRSFGCFSA
ncbi:MAG: hypothetical protein BWY17_00224 [Deltaproteobacteria bacterium ADurb.Bin207]|nr:MAG: hypothetical protein BWY17_00224 [Deltaproteobacteria bacterium ADurb.Bin207]